MAEVTIKRKDGQDAGTYTLSEKLANVAASHTTLHRTIVAEEANARQGTQKTKGRPEVRGGGRKPYKQKKTGRARQGSTRSPHYAHGAMALAITPRDYTKKVNKRERRAAILTILGAQFDAGNVSVIDAISFAEPKTKEALAFLTAIGLADTRRVLVVLPGYDEVTYKSFRNLPNVVVRTAPASVKGEEEAVKTQAFSARDLLVAHKVVIAQEALAKIEEVWAK
ncbi:MAG TPA: 50S ribosomal protein L4 [Fimbriimonas sp.]